MAPLHGRAPRPGDAAALPVTDGPYCGQCPDIMSYSQVTLCRRYDARLDIVRSDVHRPPWMLQRCEPCADEVTSP